MNKLFTKIATLSVGLAMAVGVGVAVGNNTNFVKAEAAAASSSGTAPKTDGSSGSANYSYVFASGDLPVAGATKTFNNVSWTYSGDTHGSKTYVGFSDEKGVQLGKGDAGYGASTNMTLTTAVSSFGSNKRITKTAIGLACASSGGYSGSLPNGDTISSTTTSVLYWTSAAMDVTSGNVVFTFKSTSTKKAIYVKAIYVWYENASTDPEVTLTKTGGNKIMLNKNGTEKSITGLTASSTNIINPVYKWEILNADPADVASLTSGTSTSPTSLTVSKAGSFDVKVSARASAAEDIAENYTACESNISLTIVAYGGTMSWTKRTSMVFKEGLGFDISATTIETLMNDAVNNKDFVDYDGNYSAFEIYMGTTAENVVKVTSSTVASITSSEDLNGKFYKIVDTERDISSSATQVATVTFTPKATFTLSSIGGVTEITKNQSVYLKTELVSGGWGESLTFSTDSSLISVDSTTGKITSGNTSSEDSVVVTATMENGNSQNFSMKVLSEKTYTVTELYDMVYNFNNTTESAYYGASSQSYKVEGYYYSETVDNYFYEYVVDNATNPEKMIQLYDCSNNSGVQTLVNGGIVTASGKIERYYEDGASVDIDQGTIISYVSPAAESLEISGPTEVYVGETINLSIINVQPDGAPTTVNWSVDNDEHGLVTGGEFIADQSGVYTVTAESTSTKGDSSHASDTHEIHVYEYKEATLSLKNNPKTTYYVGQTVESDLVSATVSYKCGSNDYVPTSAPTFALTTTYNYAGSALTNSAFSESHAAASLTVASATVRLTLESENTKDYNVSTDLAVSNVVVYDIEIDTANTTITPTKTTFAFGEAFTHAGNIHIAYLNGYGSRDISLDDEDVAVEDPDMEKLGVQNLKVYVDDSQHTGEALLEVGNYNIVVTNVGANLVCPAIDVQGSGFSSGSMPTNWSQKDAGSDYTSHSPYLLKMDNSGDSIVCTFPNSSFTKAKSISAELYVKMIGGNTASKFTLAALDNAGNVISTDIIAHTNTTSTSGSQNDTVTLTGSLSNDNELKVYGVQFKFVKGSNVGVSGGRVQAAATKDTTLISSQAQAMAEYLSGFKTCQSGWNDRDDIVTLVTEYNAMHNDAKTEFASLTITDYDWTKEGEYDISTHTYGGGAATKTGVNALEKLQSMVEIYNSTRTGTETELSLNIPLGGGSQAIRFGGNTSSNASTAIVVIALVSLTAVGGFFFIRKKKNVK